MFHAARIKLTAWYLAIIMTVSLLFSLLTYRALTFEVERFGRIQRYRIEHRMRNEMMLPFDENLSQPALPIDDPELVIYVKRRVFTFLSLINASIFVLSGLLGYVLAGKTLQPIAEMVDEQNRFISDASHELRTPLTALKAGLEVNLRDKSLTLESAKSVIRDSITEVNALTSLSDSLLTLAQYQKPNGSIKFEPINLSLIADEAVKRVTPLALQKDITIKVVGVSQKILGIRQSLMDVLVILLDNAIKYSHPSDTIIIRVQKIDKKVSLSIIDHGVGIAKKDLPHIFERFYRADSSRTRGGYGLGLAITKKIVDLHRGAITVKSTVGKGTTVTVTLPSA
ncbi:MAG TPA: ATP-binding protein [Patescibacteria group bacterium]|nr:ATP-binding protein [Patescibacteria group bacterium]